MRSTDKANRGELGRGFLLQSGAVSLALHCVLLAILAVGSRYSFPRGQAGVYTVSIRSISPSGGGTGSRASGGSPKALTTPLPAASATEKGKNAYYVKETIPVREKKGKPQERFSQPEKSEPIKSKKEDSIEGLKPSRGKKEEKYSSGDLQQALDEIRRQAAIDKIKSRVDRRSKAEAGTGDSASKVDSSTKGVSQVQTASAGSGVAGSGPGGTGIPGTGTGGSGTGGGGTGGRGSLFGFGSGGTVLEEYYGTIWSKVKQEWTMPGNVITKKDELETIIVVVIDKQGKVRKTWFEKKSGNNLYDQTAMRAVKKAEPFPALPRELGEDPLELGLRFTPD